MGKMISLKHVSHSVPRRIEYFYDGLVVAENGIISIDSDHPEHIRAAYFRGYQDTLSGRRLDNFQELDSYVLSETAKSERTQNVKQKGTDSRG